MGQTGTGENRQFLAAYQRVQAIDGTDAGLDKFGRIVTGSRVHRSPIDIEIFLGNDLGPTINGVAHTVEDAAQHIRRNTELDPVSYETSLGRGSLQTLRTFKQLDQGTVPINHKDTAAADFAVSLMDFHQLVIFHASYMIHRHQGADDFPDCLIIFTHCRHPLPSDRQRPDPNL